MRNTQATTWTRPDHKRLVRMIRSAHIRPEGLNDIESDSPMREGTGAGVIFGATGGVMEAALRSAYYIIKGENTARQEHLLAVRSRESMKMTAFRKQISRLMILQ